MTIQTPVRSAFASVYDADNNKVADCPDAATAAELVGMVNGCRNDLQQIKDLYHGLNQRIKEIPREALGIQPKGPNDE